MSIPTPQVVRCTGETCTLYTVDGRALIPQLCLIATTPRSAFHGFSLA